MPPWLEGDEVSTLLRQLDDGVAVDSITRISWTPGDMALCAWRLKGRGLLGLTGIVLKDEVTATCMYVIGNKQYNAAGKRKGKGGKGGRAGDTTSGEGSGPR